MNLPVGIIDAVDPNSQFSAKNIAVVARSLQTLQNKDLSLPSLASAGDDMHRKALDVESQANRVVVSDDEAYARAGALLKIIKGLQAESDKTRKRFTSPLLSLKENVDLVFSDANDKLSDSKTKIEARMISYGKEKKKREQEAAEAARKALEEETQALAAKAESAGNEKAAEAILEAGIDAAASVKAASTAVHSHGVSTNMISPKGIVIEDVKDLLCFLAGLDKGELDGVIEFKQRALTALIKSKLGDKFEPGATLGGVKVVELDQIRNY